MSKVFYIWRPDLKPPKEKSMVHLVEVLREKPKKGEKLDRRWVAVKFVKETK